MLAHRCSIGFLSCWSKNISYSSKGIYGRVAGCGSSPLSPARERTLGNWVFMECRAIGEGSSPWVCQGEEKENGQLVWSSVPLVKHRGCLGCFFYIAFQLWKASFESILSPVLRYIICLKILLTSLEICNPV